LLRFDLKLRRTTSKRPESQLQHLLQLKLLESRAESATTSQPRATPWIVELETRKPCKGETPSSGARTAMSASPCKIINVAAAILAAVEGAHPAARINKSKEPSQNPGRETIPSLGGRRRGDESLYFITRTTVQISASQKNQIPKARRDRHLRISRVQVWFNFSAFAVRRWRVHTNQSNAACTNQTAAVHSRGTQIKTAFLGTCLLWIFLKSICITPFDQTIMEHADKIARTIQESGSILMQSEKYDDSFVEDLFDRMGPTYTVMNLVSSFGFAEFWRHQCVRNAGISSGARVCDMMSGSGECWSHVIKRGASVVSVDFSRVMIQRQTKRQPRFGKMVEVRRENALQTSLENNSMDCVISAFGLKTLSEERLAGFAQEIKRILRPGGRFSLLEISTAEGWWLSGAYAFYISSVIPLIGTICLGDIECYRMLGAYTKEFRSCEHIAQIFTDAGLEVSVHRHFHGCATSLVGSKKIQYLGLL
jgi:demethylmenaquinone methyltransferase/2-methoxy-6-polyprenyl-1,4-benzoquinol methylase